MTLTSEQEKAAYSSGSVGVIAGAGTGKTYMLAERYFYHLTVDGFSPLEIVACTFTDKAAAELRSRIRATVSQRLPDRFDLLAELEAAQISTLHSLATRICQEHPELAGVPTDFRVLDELEGKIWVNEQLTLALAELPEKIYQDINYSQLVDILPKLLADPIAAERAFERAINPDSLIGKMQQSALSELLGNPQWQLATETLHQFAGVEGDRIESARKTAIQAVNILKENSKNNCHPQAALEELNNINLRGGSNKKWPDGGFTEIKEAIATLKKLADKEIKRGRINLEIGESDHKLTAILPSLKQAFMQVREFLTAAKRKARLLDFADLEVYALKALSHPEVQDYYRQRWQAFLVDEFQDTNPVQGEFLELLTSQANLTIVGDAKQSIYGFRRADVAVFQSWCDRIQHNSENDSGNKGKGGEIVELSTSFRTHEGLIHQINQIFGPLLGNLHQNLTAFRTEAPDVNPDINTYLEAYTVAAGEVNDINRCRQAEGRHIARTLKQMLDQKMPVYDKKTGGLRPVKPGDIAILSRTWDPLELYGEILASAGIPVVLSGGGNLLDTREAKDAWALLRFLADPTDDIALVAVLRSPFFAISDRTLFTMINSLETGEAKKLPWWEKIQMEAKPDFLEMEQKPGFFKKPGFSVVKILKQLLGDRTVEPPTRLLQIADRLTGYTAVINNLPGAARREADWRGFMELVRQLETGNNDVFNVVRRLRQIAAADVKITRLPLEAENAVALMTIHAAKGLEWPVVVVPDLTRSKPNSAPSVYFDPAWGVAVSLSNEAGEKQKPVLYVWLENLQKEREDAEALRLLYVAFTRSRDRLILTAASDKGSLLDLLRPGLNAAHISVEKIPLTPDDLFAPEPPLPPLPEGDRPEILGFVGSGLFELPVTALSEYIRCPKRFKFRYIDGHPGTGEGMAIAQKIGILVHKALENNIRNPETLSRFDSSLYPEQIQEVLSLAQAWDEYPDYAPYRQGNTTKETKITLTIDSITFNGVIDLLGDNFVLDYKTDQIIEPHHHRCQLWVYAAATERPQAYIAYLRKPSLFTYPRDYFQAVGEEVKKIVQDILQADYRPHAWPSNCRSCPYEEICEDAYQEIESKISEDDPPF
jgi:ATP-dependent helicase/nuclease subunit A